MAFAWLRYHIASGQAFFSGAALIELAATLKENRHQVHRPTSAIKARTSSRTHPLAELGGFFGREIAQRGPYRSTRNAHECHRGLGSRDEAEPS